MVSLQVPSEAYVSPVPSSVGREKGRGSWRTMRGGIQRALGRGEGESKEEKVEERRGIQRVPARGPTWR